MLQQNDFVRVQLRSQRGTASRYHNRIGMIRTIKDGEVGVQFSLAHNLTWFKPDELVPEEQPAWWEPLPLNWKDVPDMRKEGT